MTLVPLPAYKHSIQAAWGCSVCHCAADGRDCAQTPDVFSCSAVLPVAFNSHGGTALLRLQQRHPVHECMNVCQYCSCSSNSRMIQVYTPNAVTQLRQLLTEILPHHHLHLANGGLTRAVDPTQVIYDTHTHNIADHAELSYCFRHKQTRYNSVPWRHRNHFGKNPCSHLQASSLLTRQVCESARHNRQWTTCLPSSDVNHNTTGMDSTPCAFTRDAAAAACHDE